MQLSVAPSAFYSSPPRLLDLFGLMKSLANLYAFFMGRRAHYKLGSEMKERWTSSDLRGSEVKDHAGFGLRHYRNIGVRCLLG
jgi:hypothetical protein